MIKTTNSLLLELKEYSQPINKIHRMIKDGQLFPLLRGLYETERNVNPFYLSSSIYGPSYISFETALSYYGMIPEAVYLIKSATYKKNKKKEYKNDFGFFLYQDVNAEAYPYGIETIVENDYSFRIATKEKAVCDTLSKAIKLRNKKELIRYLYDDIRIDEESVRSLKKQDIDFLKDKYRSKNVKLFNEYLKEI